MCREYKCQIIFHDHILKIKIFFVAEKNTIWIKICDVTSLCCVSAVPRVICFQSNCMGRNPVWGRESTRVMNASLSRQSRYIFWQCQHTIITWRIVCIHCDMYCGDNPRTSRRLSHACRIIVMYNYSRGLHLQDLERGRLDSVYQFPPMI